MFKVIICDDNVSSINSLSTMLQNIFIKHDINAEIENIFTSPSELLKYTKSSDVDILFLDIDLKADINGIELANRFRKQNKNAYIIFLTAHFEFAMLAYKVKTFDYLIKPISYIKLEETILRLIDDALNNTKLYIKLGNGKHLVKQSDIFYIEKNQQKSVIHTTHSEVEVYTSFSNLMICLPENFRRCHKSYIVNTEQISEVNTKDNTLFINNNTTIPYSDKFFDLERMIFKNDTNFN